MLDPVQPLEYETGLLDDYALCLSDIARHPRSSSSTSRRVVLQSMNFVRNVQVEFLTGC